MAGKVTFIISGARKEKQNMRQQKAYQGLQNAERELREIEEKEEIAQYHRTIHHFLTKYKFFDEINVLACIVWNNIIAE